MQLLMFSGNSERNQKWIVEASKEFAELFPDRYIQDYKHWHTGDDWINIPHELEALGEQVANFHQPYAVFAKSIGTVVAVQAAAKGIINPKFMVLCGLPMGYFDVEYPQMAEDMAALEIPITIIHNEYDTVGTAQMANEYLAPQIWNRKDIDFVATPGDTHDYEEYDLLWAELAKLKDS